MLISGSCLVLYFNYFGCCVRSLLQCCSKNGCYCDQTCHILNNCCNDVADIGCHPDSSSPPTILPTQTGILKLGKIKQMLHFSYL